MGCGIKNHEKVKNPQIVRPFEDKPNIAVSNDKDTQEEKRKKMLEAAEAREKKQKLHGLSEEGLKSYEEKLKRQKLSQSNNNYEPLNWNS
jgi:tRNA U34 5-carboxymethylaminomethyl modifying GTPase MnmE/TrmE